MLSARHPVHVVLRACADIGSLRTHAVFAAVREATIQVYKHEETFRIVHFSIQKTHIHLLVEANDKDRAQPRHEGVRDLGREAHQRARQRGPRRPRAPARLGVHGSLSRDRADEPAAGPPLHLVRAQQLAPPRLRSRAVEARRGGSIRTRVVCRSTAGRSARTCPTSRRRRATSAAVAWPRTYFLSGAGDATA